MSRLLGPRRAAIAFLGIAVLFAGVTACGPLKRAGQRCDFRTEAWAHDAQNWVLQCKSNGRWTRAMTQAQANAFWAAVAAKNAAKNPAPPPAPTPPPAPPETVPMPPIGSGALKVAAGDHHSCAIAGTALKCWGSGISGQLGTGSSATTYYAVSSMVTNASSVAAGGNTTCVVTTAAGVVCFGANDSGQVGAPGGPNQIMTTPATVGISGVVQVSVGAQHACALKSDSTVWCWGDNSADQLGNGTTGGGTWIPQRVSLGLSGIVQISAGAHHTCALRNDGIVWCWGDNSFGQLGNGSGGPSAGPAAKQANVPVGVELLGGSIRNARSVAAGSSTTCLSDATKQVWCFGDNSNGNLGYGGSGSIVTPGYAPLAIFPATGLTGVMSMSAGFNFECGRLDIGQVACWGINQGIQLGAVTGTAFSVNPVIVSGLNGVTQIATSSSKEGSHTCALRNDSRVLCWGYASNGNAYNELGTGGVATGGHVVSGPVQTSPVAYFP
jgi:alpha-tubulin suppressor-like RCC1 family protein